MSFLHLFKYGLTLPPHIALAKAWKMTRKRLIGTWRARIQTPLSTYPDAVPVDGAMIGLFRSAGTSPADPEMAPEETAKLVALCDKYRAHEFDLLGSGWTPLDKTAETLSGDHLRGIEPRAASIRSLIDSDYRQLDWQRDFRAGYSWPAGQASEAIVYGHEPGVDIKVPWELARLQHLPQLALAQLFTSRPDTNAKTGEPYFREFRNQALDFIAANPPGYGVNWVCTMDVAIRAANLVMAFDLFRLSKAEMDAGFMREFVAAMRAHGRHIVHHLEWHEGFRGNHYLADICGLLFVAAFLPRDPETDAWLAFATREFVAETRLQFHTDGSNAEASTNYHRLSAEMAAYATALVVGFADDKREALARFDHTLWPVRPALDPAPVPWQPGLGPFSPDHFDRLRRAAQFTLDVTKPDGRVVQIGDTDNGRFFKLQPAVDGAALQENILNHLHLPAAIGRLLGDRDLMHKAGTGHAMEQWVMGLLAPGSPARSDASPAQAKRPRPPAITGTGKITASHCLSIVMPDGVSMADAKVLSYPDFGVYIWQSETFFLSVRCGPVGQDGRGGHAHNDQLAIELQIDGVDWIADPGSRTYTANPGLRDRYRSHFAHAGPRLVAKEPSRLNLGLFRLEDNARAQCLEFDERRFLGVHHGYGVPLYRHIECGDGQITITDTLGAQAPLADDMPETTVRSALELQDYFRLSVAFSPGYGQPG